MQSNIHFYYNYKRKGGNLVVNHEYHQHIDLIVRPKVTRVVRQFFFSESSGRPSGSLKTHVLSNS